jgi:hypothetical protein
VNDDDDLPNEYFEGVLHGALYVLVVVIALAAVVIFAL